ncbi:MAG: 5-(carboxyamino)imidazole ribonucleotide mutase [Bdellovibrionaceae bacterium]|nr:5-(carboxyamino)imidazole ribonucleotide mutase [Pseudobdellovibrionaceae bacterium]
MKTVHRKRRRSSSIATPIVGIIMGSDSDLPIMEAAGEILSEFGIGFEIRIVSAHRTPDFMLRYAHEAEGRGLQVIIAGAGGAAHLPGMVASATHLPVIGVPVQVGKLNGLDALLSIAQMPRGVPVAAMAVDNATNAGLLAARILALSDATLALKMKSFMKNQETKVREKDRKLVRTRAQRK